MVTDDKWMARALCFGDDPRFWDLDLTTDPDYAISVCTRCPVRTECLARALSEPTDGVIRGGEMFGVLVPEVTRERNRTRAIVRQAREARRAKTSTDDVQTLRARIRAERRAARETKQAS